MGGLIYKDFVAVRGKRLAWILSSLTAVYIMLRMFFPGTEDINNITDSLFLLGELMILWMGC